MKPTNAQTKVVNENLLPAMEGKVVGFRYLGFILSFSSFLFRTKAAISAMRSREMQKLH